VEVEEEEKEEEKKEERWRCFSMDYSMCNNK
jgi:hypothetical protein